MFGFNRPVAAAPAAPAATLNITLRSRVSYDGTWDIREGFDSFGFYTRVYRHGETCIRRHASYQAMQLAYDAFLRRRSGRWL